MTQFLIPIFTPSLLRSHFDTASSLDSAGFVFYLIFF